MSATFLDRPKVERLFRMRVPSHVVQRDRGPGSDADEFEAVFDRFCFVAEVIDLKDRGSFCCKLTSSSTFLGILR